MYGGAIQLLSFDISFFFFFFFGGVEYVDAPDMLEHYSYTLYSQPHTSLVSVCLGRVRLFDVSTSRTIVFFTRKNGYHEHVLVSCPMLFGFVCFCGGNLHRNVLGNLRWLHISVFSSSITRG
ncbi:hypothetical protein MLD38_021291 [Melastoma candidum]|uniref:Uncharacterized protein n=1 Tax=Melastoma candidum TaxID=119954 RepID=A0ACB9QFT7_9MYRT|nr:hypothetical protein MLD38_021291 [Melastoma candidum]